MLVQENQLVEKLSRQNNVMRRGLPYHRGVWSSLHENNELVLRNSLGAIIRWNSSLAVNNFCAVYEVAVRQS